MAATIARPTSDRIRRSCRTLSELNQLVGRHSMIHLLCVQILPFFRQGGCIRTNRFTAINESSRFECFVCQSSLLRLSVQCGPDLSECVGTSIQPAQVKSLNSPVTLLHNSFSMIWKHFVWIPDLADILCHLRMLSFKIEII